MYVVIPFLNRRSNFSKDKSGIHTFLVRISASHNLPIHVFDNFVTGPSVEGGNYLTPIEMPAHNLYNAGSSGYNYNGTSNEAVVNDLGESKPRHTDS